MITCPNCRSFHGCDCTWEDQQEAMDIRRKQAAERRRKHGKPTVVEAERERKKKGAASK